MSHVLLIDFGSTYTKLTAVDVEKEEILGTARGITTVETDIMEGLQEGLDVLFAQTGKLEFQRVLGCSSAAGGLKMVAIGLVPELTAEAAKRAALGAGAKVLGGFEVGDGAKIGSNAVVIKPVPPGATAVGIPARILPSKDGTSADATPDAPKFTAYGVTQEDDPLSQAMRGLVDGAACHEEQLAKLWEVVEKLSVQLQARDCVPSEAERGQHFETEKIKQILGK